MREPHGPPLVMQCKIKHSDPTDPPLVMQCKIKHSDPTDPPLVMQCKVKHSDPTNLNGTDGSTVSTHTLNTPLK